MATSTNLYSKIKEYVEKLYDETTDQKTPIRRLTIWFSCLADESAEGYDLFCDLEQMERERKREEVVLEIKERFGKNAILRGFNLREGATQAYRNTLIGGHNGGEEK